MLPHYVFDAYGTLFDVHAAAARNRAAIGPEADRMSQIWRTKHLEYTWIHAQTGRHTTFWSLAGQSLDYAMAIVGLKNDALREQLLATYRVLDCYAEVPAVLARLKDKGATVSLLTNGDPDMVAEAVASAKLGGVLDAVMTVHEAGVFKPDMRVYHLVTERFGCRPADVSFQSSNRWDVAAAHVAGFRPVWINRFAMPPEYPDMPPAHVIATLDPLPEL
jgi:2-haloacid dehalogenase